jgi:hypothetical protein
MMKKLLIFMLVLGMTSWANAVLTLSIGGADTMNPGETKTYTVSYVMVGLPNNALVSADQDILSTLGATVANSGISHGVVITTNRDTVLDLVRENPLTHEYQVSITNDVAGTDMGSPLFSFDFTAPLSITSPTVVTLSLYENSYFDAEWNMVTGSDLILNTKGVTIIPEPATIMLLGLGGLLLRRRK